MITSAFYRAATGDKAAQIEMVEASIGMAAQGKTERYTSFVEASVFARMAVAQGDNVDRARLVSVLALLADELVIQGRGQMADAAQGEAIAHLDFLADAGEQLAEQNMSLVAEHSTPAQLQFAKQFRKAWGLEEC